MWWLAQIHGQDATDGRSLVYPTSREKLLYPLGVGPPRDFHEGDEVLGDEEHDADERLWRQPVGLSALSRRIPNVGGPPAKVDPRAVGRRSKTRYGRISSTRRLRARPSGVSFFDCC